MRALLVSAGATLAAAQDWGTSGAWELMTPTNMGPAIALRHPTSVAGMAAFMANNSVTTNKMIVGFDVVANTWRTYPDINRPFGNGFSLTIGGQIFVVDEVNMNNVAYIDSECPANQGKWLL